jgi:hypothetical protein
MHVGPRTGFPHDRSGAADMIRVAVSENQVLDLGLANGQARGSPRRRQSIDYRWADGQYDRLPELAADLVGRQVASLGLTSATLSNSCTKIRKRIGQQTGRTGHIRVGGGSSPLRSTTQSCATGDFLKVCERPRIGGDRCDRSFTETARRYLSGSVHLAHGPAGIPQGGDS